MKLLELIRAAFANLATLGEQELADLRANIVKCAGEFKDESDESVAALGELGDMAEAVKTRSTEIATAKAEAAAKAEDARQRIASLDAPEDSDQPEGDTPVEETPAEETETPEETPAEVPEAIAASGLRSTPERMAAGRGGVSISPELAAATRARPALTASAQSRLKGYGDEIADRVPAESRL